MVNFVLIKLIRFYQIFISPFLGQNCRFYPTCSNYSIQALKEYGLFKGGKLIILRILKCNPWGGSGIDTLPKSNAKNKD